MTPLRMLSWAGHAIGSFARSLALCLNLVSMAMYAAKLCKLSRDAIASRPFDGLEMI